MAATHKLARLSRSKHAKYLNLKQVKSFLQRSAAVRNKLSAKERKSKVLKSPCFFLFLHPKQTEIMGRGDKRTKRGKISSGSFGKSRPARVVKKVVATAEKKA